jgi:hypothetical protein
MRCAGGVANIRSTVLKKVGSYLSSVSMFTFVLFPKTVLLCDYPIVIVTHLSQNRHNFGVYG